MIITDVFVIEGLGDYTDELLGDVVGEEISEVHYACVILATEPRLFLALALTSYVAMVATRYLFACAKVLPQAVFEECLGQAEFDEASISTDWERLGTME